jgi:hypothetical protein
MKKDKKQIFLFTEIFALEKKQYDPKLINEIDSDKHVIPSNYKSAAQCSLDNRPTKKIGARAKLKWIHLWKESANTKFSVKNGEKMKN